jgi:uncharacterized protein (DUF488 family)
MIKIYTIGFTQKSAKHFFDTLYDNGIEMMIDIRINNISQLAGFAKGDDLEYFLDKIYGIKYVYRSVFAPTKELLKDYRDKVISWDEYIIIYNRMLDERNSCKNFLKDYANYNKVCLLCSEATAEKCHRRLLADRINQIFPTETEVIHL